MLLSDHFIIGRGRLLGFVVSELIIFFSDKVGWQIGLLNIVPGEIVRIQISLE